MNYRRILGRVAYLFVISYLAGCGHSPKPIDRSTNDRLVSSDYPCERLIEEIRRVDITKEQTKFLSLNSIFSEIFLRKTNNLERQMDPFVDAFFNKGCVIPEIEGDLESRPLRHFEHSNADGQTAASTFLAPKLETLPFSKECSKAFDREKRIYELGITNLQYDEYLKFTTIGKDSISYKIKASYLLFADVKLPELSVTSRSEMKGRGLWVERLKTGEKHQLNYLRPNFSCNSNGVVVVEYQNTWVTAKRLN